MHIISIVLLYSAQHRLRACFGMHINLPERQAANGFLKEGLLWAFQIAVSPCFRHSNANEGIKSCVVGLRQAGRHAHARLKQRVCAEVGPAAAPARAAQPGLRGARIAAGARARPVLGRSPYMARAELLVRSTGFCFLSEAASAGSTGQACACRLPRVLDHACGPQNFMLMGCQQTGFYNCQAARLRKDGSYMLLGLHVVHICLALPAIQRPMSSALL